MSIDVAIYLPSEVIDLNLNGARGEGDSVIEMSTSLGIEVNDYLLPREMNLHKRSFKML